MRLQPEWIQFSLSESEGLKPNGSHAANNWFNKTSKLLPFSAIRPQPLIKHSVSWPIYR